MTKFPWMSPYVAFDNDPVYYVDPYGLASENGEGGGQGDGKKDSKASRKPDEISSEEKSEMPPLEDVDGVLDEVVIKPKAKTTEVKVDNQASKSTTFGSSSSFFGKIGSSIKNFFSSSDPYEGKSELVMRNGVLQFRDWRKGFSKKHKPIQKYSDGHTIFHDDINNQTEIVQAQWRRSRAKVKAVNNLVEGIMMNAAVSGLSLGTAPGLSFVGRFVFGASSNTFNQLSYNDFDYKQIDVTNVIASGLTNGLVPNVYSGGMKPLIKLISVNGVDAMFDYTSKDGIVSVFGSGYQNKTLGKARVDFGFGMVGGVIPSASPLIPYQIQMIPSSFLIYGINDGVNKSKYPSK